MALAAAVVCAGGSARADAPPSPASWVPSWAFVHGGYRQMEDMTATSATNAWGVDNTVISVGGQQRPQTAVVHVTGTVWRTEAVLDGTALGAVDADGPGLVLAVGGAGAIHRYNGRTWQVETSPVTARLRDVAIGSARRAWAVGDQSTLLTWDGSQWLVEKPPERGVSFNAVAAPAADDAWALMDGGKLARWREGEWIGWPAPIVPQPRDVAFASPDRGLVVGGKVIAWDGESWRELEEDYAACDSVAWSGDVAYLVCDGKPVRYSDTPGFEPVDLATLPAGAAEAVFRRVVAAPGITWALATDGTVITITDLEATYVRPVARQLGAIDVLADGPGWAGGSALTAGLVGTAADTWDLVHSLPEGEEVLGIDLVSSTDGWAVGRAAGEPPPARMWHWDGTLWRDFAVDKTWQIGRIQMTGPDDGWVGRGNVIARWDGARWQQVLDAPAGAAEGGFAVVSNGQTQGWFGGRGQIAHLVDDRWEWQSLAASDQLVIDIEVPSPDEGWAATENELFRYDGEAWHRDTLTLSSAAVIRDVDAHEPGKAWVLVVPDGLFHWNGFAWERHDLRPFGDAFDPLALCAVRPDPGSPSTDVWLAGGPPSIARYRVVAPVSTMHLPILARRARLDR